MFPSTHSGRKEGRQDDNSPGPQGESYPAWMPCLALPLTHMWVLSCSVAHSCLTLCDPVDCIPPGSSIHGIFQAKILAANETVGKLTSPLLCLGFSLSNEEVEATAEIQWKQQLFLSTSQVPGSARAGTRWRGPRCHRFQPARQQA